MAIFNDPEKRAKELLERLPADITEGFHVHVSRRWDYGEAWQLAAFCKCHEQERFDACACACHIDDVRQGRYVLLFKAGQYLDGRSGKLKEFLADLRKHLAETAASKNVVN